MEQGGTGHFFENGAWGGVTPTGKGVWERGNVPSPEKLRIFFVWKQSVVVHFWHYAYECSNLCDSQQKLPGFV